MKPYPIAGSFLAVVLAGGLASPDPPRAAAEVHGQCGACHLPDGRRADGEAVAEGGDSQPDCLQCHQDLVAPPAGAWIRAALAGAPPSHGGPQAPSAPARVPLGDDDVEAMTCLTCHVAHPNGQPHLLRKLQPAARAAAHRGLDPVSAFCVACHARAAEFERSGGHYGRHPVGVRVRSGLLDAPPGLDVPLVDVRGTADPSDDVVSCATCHRVHAGSNAFLLRWDLEDLPAACRSCHAVDGDVGPSGAPAAIAARRR